MKKLATLLLFISLLLVGCVDDGLTKSENGRTEKELVKVLDKNSETFMTTEEISTETEFGTDKQTVVKLKENLTDEEELAVYQFADDVVEYAEVATEQDAFASYLMMLGEVRERFPHIMTVDVWQNTQEHWQELNDPID